MGRITGLIPIIWLAVSLAAIVEAISRASIFMGHCHPTIWATPIAYQIKASVGIDPLADVSCGHEYVLTVRRATKPAHVTVTNEASHAVTRAPEGELGFTNCLADTICDRHAPGAAVGATVTPGIVPPAVDSLALTRAEGELAARSALASAETTPQAASRKPPAAAYEDEIYDAVAVAAAMARRSGFSWWWTARRSGAVRVHL